MPCAGPQPRSRRAARVLDDEVSLLAPVPIVLEPLVLPEPVAELLVPGEVVDELLELGVLVPLLIEPLPVAPVVPELPVVPVVLLDVPLPDVPLVLDEGLVDDDVPEPLVPVALLVPLPLMLPPWLGATVAPWLPGSTGTAPGPDWVVVLVLPPALPPAPVPALVPEPLVPALVPEPEVAPELSLPAPPEPDWA